jgi:DNA-binding transcriptional ArsR family regulator
VATYLERAFEALGDPTRLLIFQKIAGRAQSVGELAEGLPVSRPAVSQHLQVLKRAGLVDADQDGTRRVYRVRPEGIEALRQYFDDLWSRNLKAFKATAERRGSDDIRRSSNRTSKKVH